MGALITLYAGKTRLEAQSPQARIRIAAREDGALQVSLPKALKCSGCGRMSLLFVSRGGVTRCASECDAKALEAAR